jgi:Fe-S-cluster containining protein
MGSLITIEEGSEHISGVACAAKTTDIGSFCVACASQGKSCCQGHDIYITPGDCKRIMQYFSKTDFYEYRGCGNLDYADPGDDPIWSRHVFRADGSRRVLRSRPDGDCCFLTPTGCCLPLTVRPLICRLYPHLYTAAGILEQWDGACPAARQHNAALVETCIAGIARIEALQWHHILYQEIIQEGSADENWLNL